MGDWNIQVAGTGIHHNGIAGDADQIYKRLVQELESAGHTIRFKSFSQGSQQPETVQPLKDEPTYGA